MSDFPICEPNWWSLLPPVFTLVLALATREIVVSLFMGLLSGALIHSIECGHGLLYAVDTVLLSLSEKVGENMPMVIFLFLLGALVAVVTASGGAKAYGEWAFRRLHSQRAASLMTCAIGIIIFIDDYFNCLTVGGVMRPVTDRFKISREKLAYFIDATAAPVCIMAPISSWAAYVISCMPDDARANGMALFVRAIPMNLYAILTLVMVGWIAIRRNSDYGLMRRVERLAQCGHELGTEKVMRDGTGTVAVTGRGGVVDLVVPIGALIVFSFLSLLYYGGYWTEPKTMSAALGSAEPGKALAVSAIASILVAFLLYIPRKLLSFHDFSSAILRGFKTMVPALVLLALAWALSGVCNDLLGTGKEMSKLVCAVGFKGVYLPAVAFVIAAVFSFATGASWCVIGIFVPVIFEICRTLDPSMTMMSLAATLSGAVLGDHCSPIADTTILSSAGAGCKHMVHVATQMPYALTVGVISLIGYLIAGVLSGFGYWIAAIVPLLLSFVLLGLVLYALELKSRRRLPMRP